MIIEKVNRLIVLASYKLHWCHTFETFYMASERLGYMDYHFTNQNNQLSFDIRGFDLIENGLFTLEVKYGNTTWTCANDTLKYPFMSCSHLIPVNTTFNVDLVTFFMDRKVRLNSYYFDTNQMISFYPVQEFDQYPDQFCISSNKVDYFQSLPMTIETLFCCWG